MHVLTSPTPALGIGDPAPLPKQADGSMINLEIGQLLANKIQHDKRCTPGAIRGLLNEIKSSGWIAPLLVCLPDVNGLYPIATGHRRLEVAKILGYTHVLCMVLPVSDPTLAFVQDANGVRNVSGRDYLMMWCHDDSALEHFPASVRAKIEVLKKWVGSRELRHMVTTDGAFAPSMVMEVRKVVSLIDTYQIEGKKTIQPGDVLSWMIAHGQTQSVRRELKTSLTARRACARRILHAIHENRAL